MALVHVTWAESDAHALLRAVVADRADARPGEVEVQHRCRTCGATDHGRPLVVVAGRPGPQVSLARAGRLSIVAVADREVGIDLERAVVPAPSEPPRLEAVVLSERERGPLAGAPDGRTAAVLRAWVRKEAVLKALGHGLVVDPRLVELSTEGPRPKLVGWGGPGRRPQIRLLDIDAGPGLVAAVACVGRRRVAVEGRRGGISG